MESAPCLGLMSGTSMDGIDAVLVSFGQPGAARIAVHAALTRPYSTGLRQQLRALGQGSMNLAEFGAMDIRVAEEFAGAARQVLELSGMAPEHVAAIGSHGQTVLHLPGGKPPFSLQLGDPGTLAVRTGLPVVADFRNADIALGGQGAPLVPPFHRYAFGVAGERRAVVNIGGIANLTLLAEDGSVTAFDTGPGNTLLDGWCARHRGQPFDAGGEWAAGAPVHEALLRQLLAEDYFAAPPPKSTGLELFDAGWVEKALARLDEAVDPREVQSTLTELSALTIAEALQRQGGAPELAVCGGGARNDELMRRLRRRLPGMTVTTTADWGLAPDWVEAAAFAWLAHERLHGRPGNLPSATGARKAVPLGGLYLPPGDL